MNHFQAITTESIRPWLYMRSSTVNNDVKNAFEKYLKNVKITFDKPDVREPDFMFYEGHEGTLNIYRFLFTYPFILNQKKNKF